MGEFLGRTVELDVTNIAHGGISVARLDGRVVFVADAIPGERVEAIITSDSKRSFWRADAVRVLEASPHRQPHVWAEASIDRAPEHRAGGAEFGHIDIAHQRELKRQVLVDAMTRMAKLDLEAVAPGLVVEAIPGEADGTGWRTRVSLHVAPDGTLGPFAARSHTVVAVDSLPLATAEVAAAAPLAERFVGEERVDVLAPARGGARLVIGKQKPSVITEVVGEREFRLDDTGFWQVHDAAAQTLTRAVQQAIDDSLLDPAAMNLDLYGGVGLLAAALGDVVGPSLRITTVESDARATEHAAENLSEWIGARAETGRVERWIAQLAAEASASERARRRAGTVVLDPPRSGAGGEVVRQLAALAPAQIVYVACDPVALARDVASFADAGYRLGRLRAFDLFPHTHHVEAIATLERE
jgi:tRNA/tmRNA/rRNA uracil-C5-methylase (TrmA/RlmC/RlmD family)